MEHGGRIIARALAKEDVTHLFTLCGGHIQAIYDGCIDEGIEVVDVRHEQSAAHAADGYARSTGRCGVCAVTAGPGTTDAVTGVANAHRAGVPMVVLGGAGPHIFRHQGSLQDMDHVELLEPVTKWAARVSESRRLPEYMAIAFRKAMTGVPGPVYLEIPLDTLMDFKDPDKLDWYDNYRTEAANPGDPEYIDRAAELLTQAERPMAIVGSQLRWSKRPEAMDRFVDELNMPTFVNGMARGSIDPDSDAFLNRARTPSLKKSDCILVFGTPFDFRLDYGQPPKFNPDAKVIQIDLDPEEVGRNRDVHVGITGDTGLVMEGLCDAIEQKGGLQDLEDWWSHVREVEDEKWAPMREQMTSEEEPINPLRLCAEVNKFIDDDTVVIGDGGDFVATAAYTLEVNGLGNWMDPGPLGTLGVGPGYAMAAKLTRPDSQVVIMYGDGSFGFNGMEFDSFVRQGINVVGIIGNDACWRQIKRGQVDMFGEERAVATDLAMTRYDKVVEGLGGHGEFVESLDELPGALERAFESDVASLVNVEIGTSDFREGAISV
jgi:acetolactate synthase-1/2/3 large subunit